MTRIAALVGPTGGGKTALAIELARRVPLEVISCDSQAVYRGMDVGTAKPTPAERAAVPHHLVDVAGPEEEFTAARFAELADRVIADVAARGRLPLVVGGTGLWLRALLKGLVPAPPRDAAVRSELEGRITREGSQALHRELAELDPAAAARIRPRDPVRIVRALEVFRLTGERLSELQRRHGGGAPRHDAVLLGVNPPREELHRRLDARAAAMFAAGLAEETARLAIDPGVRARLERIMGYREALRLLEGAIDREEAVRLTAREQRRYARRQLTWFRAMPEVEWLPWPPDVEEAAARLHSR